MNTRHSSWPKSDERWTDVGCWTLTTEDGLMVLTAKWVGLPWRLAVFVSGCPMSCGGLRLERSAFDCQLIVNIAISDHIFHRRITHRQ
jgi:hypothetical protein